jgi:hypothetical protein
MSAQSGIKLAIGGLIVYMMLVFTCLLFGDRQHALMFLAGSVIWVIAIFIWIRTKKDEKE